MAKVHATYEGGVFRPTTPVALPERAEVEFEPRLVRGRRAATKLDAVYAVLGERYESGQQDVAARHDEHPPARR
jgi:predicted DNA-binding antitoxin AbrB/MazE fold protein